MSWVEKNSNGEYEYNGRCFKYEQDAWRAYEYDQALARQNKKKAIWRISFYNFRPRYNWRRNLGRNKLWFSWVNCCRYYCICRNSNFDWFSDA